MSIKLQKRDIQILKNVFTFRVASYETLLKRYFLNCHRTAAYRRIRGLKKEGLLKLDTTVMHDRSKTFFRLNESAWTMICNSWPFEIDSPYFMSESPEHDLRLNDVCHCFERLKSFKGFYSENLLQSSSELKADKRFSDLAKIYADGALVLKGPDGQPYVYGIELELSKKSPERYLEKLNAYYNVDGIDGVVYITADQEISKAIAKADASVCNQNDSILYLGLEADVLKPNDKIYFKNAKANGIELF